MSCRDCCSRSTTTGRVGQAFNITNDQSAHPAAAPGGARPGDRRQAAAPPRPYRALYAAGYLAERLAALSLAAQPAADHPARRGFFGTDNRYAIGKARRELGYRPRVALREGSASPPRGTGSRLRAPARCPAASRRRGSVVGMR